MTYLPNSELVVVTWLRTRTTLSASQVATSLPAPVDGVLPWASTGFVTVRGLSSGLPRTSIHLPIRSPFMTIDTWAAPANGSNKPRWNQAAQLAEQIRLSMDNDVQEFGKILPLGPDYQDARTLALYLITEPRRVENDPNAYARYSFDIIADWVLA